LTGGEQTLWVEANPREVLVYKKVCEFSLAQRTVLANHLEGTIQYRHERGLGWQRSHDLGL